MSRKYSKRRNYLNKPVNTFGYIKKYFGDDIKKILTPSNKSLQLAEYPYVHHEEAETVVRSWLEKDEQVDKTLVFTGLTGSGKTTILSQVFGFTTNSNRAEIRDNKLIIPIDFNRSQKSAEEAILSSLRSGIDLVCKKYMLTYPNMDSVEFQSFVEKVRPDGLHLNPRETTDLSGAERMMYLQQDMPILYASCQLQFVLNMPECKIELVIMIVDNVEAFSGEDNTKKRYFEPVIEAFQLAECIQRRSITKWSYNLIVACRHYVWRIIRGEYSDESEVSAILESYITSCTAYDLCKPVKVKDIVEAREEVFSDRQKDKERWMLSVKIVNSIMRKMEGRIGDFILELYLKNIRKSMIALQELILHSGLQKVDDDNISKGAFNIESEEQFDLSRVNLIRTIGLGNNKYYSETSIIPNLLYNEQSEGMELFPLLSLKYFLIRCEYSEPDWNNGISIQEFYKNMNDIFQFDDRTMNRIFNGNIKYFLKHRLLLRSADQPQEEVPGLSNEEILKIEDVYVSGISVAIWDELAKSSALFQLYIDDIWLDTEKDYFGEDGNDIEHCFMYLCELVKIEERIYNSARNIGAENAIAYLNCFGEEMICSHLAKGLKSSLTAIVSNSQTSRTDRAKITLGKLDKVISDLRKFEKERLSEISKQ